MRWPWARHLSGDQLIVSWSAGVLAYVRVRAKAGGTYEVRKLGVERQGDASMPDFVKRLQDLGLKGIEASVMLRPEQYQVLQIESPPVPPEELRAASRFQIRDMVSTHIDDITLDVLRVGDGQGQGPQKGANQLFVVAATTAALRAAIDLSDAMHWDVTVVDVQETAQRNLQSAMARRESRLERADATIMVSDERQAVITISAKEELYYTRRLDLPEGFMNMTWGSQIAAVPEVQDAFAPVEEYVPDYAAEGQDYSAPAAAGGGMQSDDDERVQRFVVEVQRSLDLWDRTWSSMPLGGVRVYAADRSAEMAQWLTRDTGQSVTALGIEALFTGLDAVSPIDQAYCMPLLGMLMRTEGRVL